VYDVRTIIADSLEGARGRFEQGGPMPARRVYRIGRTLHLLAAVAVLMVSLGSGSPALAQGAAAGGGRGAQPTPPCGPELPPSIKNVDRQSRCFELRTYTVQEGSSIDLLHSRFRDHTNALFRKHGMTIIGFWQPVAKPNVLVYLLAYKDGAARDAAWAAFNMDPEWVKTRTEMQVAVQVENVFMSATDYSPMK